MELCAQDVVSSGEETAMPSGSCRTENTPLRDAEIREVLRAKLRELYASEPETIIIDELSLCQGDARVDIAVVNGSFHGYEIKSDRDTLDRLPGQRPVYGVCFDSMTIVVGTRHVAECRRIVPRWWGIWEAVRDSEGVRIECRREPQPNADVSPESLVQLLWKDETLAALREIGFIAPTKATRRELWSALVSMVPPAKLSEIVRGRLKARGDWRSGPTPFRGGGSSRSSATFQRSQENRAWLLSRRFQHRQH
jgi:hypothetical protein